MIYIVTLGDYSAYHINGVFSTREKAVAYISELRKEDSSVTEDDIEEWEVDKKASMVCKEHAIVKLSLQTGQLKDSQQMGFRRELVPSDFRGTKHVYTARGLAVGISCVSYEHALKLAAEARQDWLREGSLALIEKHVFDEDAA